MSAGDGERSTGDCDDTSEFVESLSNFKLRVTELDQETTKNLADRCLAKFDDTRASLECRAIALYTVVAQITSGNGLMLAHLTNVCDRVRTNVAQTPLVTGVGAADFHRELVYAISVILQTSPTKFVDTCFGAVVHYLVQLVSSETVELATMACEFWTKYASLPTVAMVRRPWMTAFQPELPALITSLMDQMIYRPAHAEHLEQFTSRCWNLASADKSLPVDVGAFANLRNVAAVAFERIADVYSCDMVCTTFKPLLEKRIESESWLEKEAAILALAAFTEGTGTPDAMQEAYSVIVPRVMDCYADPHPLLRSIACFTMPKLVGHRLRGVKDPWFRVLTCTAKATRDSCPEVRSVAIRALSTLLAYGTGSGSPGRPSGVDGQTSRLVDALIRAGQFEMNTETRCAYFECISHLVGRASDSLTASDMDHLMPPLVAAWKSQPWDRAMDGESGCAVEDPQLGIVPFSMALANIVTYGKSLYAPHAEAVFEKACADIAEIVKFAASRHRENEEGDDGLRATVCDNAMTSHVICCLDLLSAHFDGLGDVAGQFASRLKLLLPLHSILIAAWFDERVYQSSLALLGHVLSYEPGTTEPSVDVFLDVIRTKLEMATASKTRANALWALTHTVNNPTASDQSLQGFVDQLIHIFMCTKEDSRCIIYAASSLTSICARRATDPTSVAIVTRRDVFLHLSGLLRAQFPRPLEKRTIFSNVVSMLTPAAVNKVPAELWSAFLTAVVADDQAATSDELNSNDFHKSLRSLLREIRSTLGSAGWTSAMLDMGSQPATALRRRFKLF